MIRIFSVLVFIAGSSFPFSIFVKNTNGFLDLVSDVVFGFFPIWVPVSLRSERQICTTTDLECRKTSVRSTCHHCIGSIRVLITGIRKNLSVLTVSQAVCGFDPIL